MGNVVKKGLVSVENTIDKHYLFIVIVSGYGLGGDSFNYFLAEDEERHAVINSDGDFVINPKYFNIYFDEDKNYFVCTDETNKEINFDITGKIIKA